MIMSTQSTYKAKIQPSVGGSTIEVSVQANDVFQAKKLIESLYGPVKFWQWGPLREIKK